MRQIDDISTPTITRRELLLFALLIAISLPIKLFISQQIPFDLDYVAVVANGRAWLDGGAFPATGTLSSVAAYNMPMLVWMYTPAQIFISDTSLSIIITGIIMSTCGTWAMWRVGTEMLTPFAGWGIAILFTFSETAMSSTYIAWAQVHLASWFALILWAMWRWVSREQGVYLALVGIFAVSTFMLHFASIMVLPIILISALAWRAKWQWRGLLIGTFICLLLFVPYLMVQVERDFSDLRAFLSRDVQVSSDIMAQYEYLKPENQAQLTPQSATPTDEINNIVPESDTNTSPASPTLLDRILNRVIPIPQQIMQGFALPYQSSYRIFELVLFALGTVLVGWQMRSTRTILALRNTLAGRTLVVFGMTLGVILGFILTRNTPQGQSTYYMGLLSWQLIPIGFAIATIAQWGNYWRYGISGVLILITCLSVIDRIERNNTHDNTALNNAWIYRHIEATTDAIGTTWDEEIVTVAYDILPYYPVFWWVAPWHTIDESYTIGMSYDYLLAQNHGIINQNTNPLGDSEPFDYLITLNPNHTTDYADLRFIDTFGAVHLYQSD